MISGRHADDDARAHPDVAVVGLLDEVGQHLFGDVEVGDDAILHRLDRDDVAGRAAQHLLRFATDGFDAAVDLVDRHDRRLVDDDAAAFRIDAGIGRPEIDRQIGREKRQKRTQTQVTSLSDSGVAAACRRAAMEIAVLA